MPASSRFAITFSGNVEAGARPASAGTRRSYFHAGVVFAGAFVWACSLSCASSTFGFARVGGLPRGVTWQLTNRRQVEDKVERTRAQRLSLPSAQDACSSSITCVPTSPLLARRCTWLAAAFACANVNLDAKEAMFGPSASIAAERPRRLSEAMQSGRPIILRFSASWCPGCKKLEKEMRAFEREYGQDVEFVKVDVSDKPPSPGAQWWVNEFGVGQLPHVAFIGPQGDVRTALVGEVSASAMEADLRALRDGKRLPYTMYDAFQGGRRPSLPPGWRQPAAN